MSQMKSLRNMSVAELENLLEERKKAEYSEKKAELASAKAKVKELEAYFAPVGRTPPAGKSASEGASKKKRAKKGNLRAAVLAFLGKGEFPLKEIVAGVHGNYGTVAQLIAKLKKEKVISQKAGRGAAYSLAK